MSLQPSCSISVDLLQALLSVDTVERQNAEEKLRETSLSERVSSLVEALMRHNNDDADGTLLHLVAVLLRRDILKMTAAQDSNMLLNLVSPLLQAFVNAPASTKNAVGHCLAEVCAVLEITATNNATGLSTIVISRILAAIAPLASQGDLPSLDLLVALADRSPQSFAQTALPSLPQLLQSLVQHPVFFTDSPENTQPNWPDKGRLYTVATQIVATTAIASVGGGLLDLAPDARADDTQPNPHSVASQLGTQTFVPLLSIADKILSDRETLGKILPLWMQAAQSAPDLFIDPQVWERTLPICLQVSSQDLDSKLALQAINILNYLAVHLKNQLPNDQRQMILQSILPRIMKILQVEVDSDFESWASQPVTSSTVDKDTFGDDDGEAQYAYEMLEAWIHIAPAVAMAVLLPLLEQNLVTGEWCHAWAAIVGIQACAEEAPVTFAAHIPTAVQAALQLANSSNPRVQYQAIQLLAVICETGKSVVWEQFAERILRVLATAMASTSDRVRAMACVALVEYCRPQGREMGNGERFVVPYLYDLLHALVNGPLSSSSESFVIQNRAVQAVICLAHVSGPSFGPYYSRVMPVLLNVASHEQSDEYERVQLQATAIEAATVLGQSLGEENAHLFAVDASRIMQWIIPLLEQWPDDDGNSNEDKTNCYVPMSQLLSSCARIASVIGTDYEQYAHAVVPRLIRRAHSVINVEISEADVSALEDTNNHNKIEVDEDTGKESLAVAVPGLGLTKFTLDTTKVQEKVEAIRGIYEHALALEGLFMPYAQSCFDVLRPLLYFRYHSDVRATSAQSLAAVFEAVCCHGEETGDFNLCSTTLPNLALELAQAVRDENEMDALFALADALCAILLSAYVRRQQHGQALMQNFSIDHAKVFVGKCLQSALIPCLERRSKIAQKLSNPQNLSGEDEKESYQELLAREEKLITSIVDATGYTLKLFGEMFYPVFKEIVAPVLGPYLNEGFDVRARLAALCLFDDCVEFCGAQAAVEVGPALFNGIVLSLDDSSNGGDAELKQAAVYGVIQLARRQLPPGFFTAQGQTIVDYMWSIANGAKEDAPSLAVFEDCVSAMASLFLLGKAPLRSSGVIQPELVLSIFLKNLPLTEDYDDAKVCHAEFCNLVVSGQIDVDGECATILRVSGEILALVQEGEDVATKETCDTFTVFLNQLHTSPKSIMVASTFELLPESSKSAIQAALQDTAAQNIEGTR